MYEHNFKMYGTIFNYAGFGLQAMNCKTPDACVPEYAFDLYHNNESLTESGKPMVLTLNGISATSFLFHLFRTFNSIESSHKSNFYI